MNFRGRSFNTRTAVMGVRARDARRAELGRLFEVGQAEGRLTGDWRALPLGELERVLAGVPSTAAEASEKKF
jgi:hypothetical protein